VYEALSYCLLLYEALSYGLLLYEALSYGLLLPQQPVASRLYANVVAYLAAYEVQRSAAVTIY
jgi:hypothetical protein